jgi:hypothetical protein
MAPLKKRFFTAWRAKRLRRFRLTGAGAGGENHDAECASARIPAERHGHRDRYDLVFNAQGKRRTCSPGATAPQSLHSVEPDMLIPADLRKTYDMANLPQADILDDVALGGEARLTATSAGERESRMNALLVWGVLIAGVILLAGMAWRIWRETQRKA